MSEEMYLVSEELVRCFNTMGRLQKLRADISRDLRILEREVQRLLADCPSNAQVQQNDEIEDLEKLWRIAPPPAARKTRKRRGQ